MLLTVCHKNYAVFLSGGLYFLIPPLLFICAEEHTERGHFQYKLTYVNCIDNIRSSHVYAWDFIFWFCPVRNHYIRTGKDCSRQ